MTHCKPSADVFPVCVWKDDKELVNVTQSKFLPTTPVPTLPPLKTTKRSSMTSVTSVPFPKLPTLIPKKATSQGVPVQTKTALPAVSFKPSTIARPSPATVSKVISTPNTSIPVPAMTSTPKTTKLVPSLSKLTTPQRLQSKSGQTFEPTSFISTGKSVTIVASGFHTGLGKIV